MRRTFCLPVPGTYWCQLHWWKKPSRSSKTPRGLGRTRRSSAAVAYRLPITPSPEVRRIYSRTFGNSPSTHSGEYCRQTDYESYHARASKVKEEAMIERTNAPGLSQPPSYSHVVVVSEIRLVTTAGAPLQWTSAVA